MALSRGTRVNEGGEKKIVWAQGWTKGKTTRGGEEEKERPT